MTAVAASAPGKVVLTGEYAVLSGAPAIAMAVNRRACVRFRAGSAALECTGVVADGDTRLFDTVLARVAPGAASDGAFWLDTSGFLSADPGRKLGIGSSAALSVALTGAAGFISGAAGHGQAELAFTAHESLQGGKGSGIDVATSLRGGLIEYRRDGRRIRSIDWPEGLSMALIWTGVSTSTDAMLGKLDMDNVDFTCLAAAAEQAAAAWVSADARDIVAATDSYMLALADFDQQHQLGITGGGHDRLLDAAASRPIAYKPCGAGGGDIGVVLGSNRDDVAAFVASAEELGFSELDARIDPNGLAVSGWRR